MVENQGFRLDISWCMMGNFTASKHLSDMSVHICALPQPCQDTPGQYGTCGSLNWRCPSVEECPSVPITITDSLFGTGQFLLPLMHKQELAGYCWSSMHWSYTSLACKGSAKMILLSFYFLFLSDLSIKKTSHAFCSSFNGLAFQRFTQNPEDIFTFLTI